MLRYGKAINKDIKLCDIKIELPLLGSGAANRRQGLLLRSCSGREHDIDLTEVVRIF
jgi:hypothetical protein